MPDPPQGARQIVALAMVASAITLVVLAVLIYTGTVPLPSETRFVATLVVSAAALLDFVIGVWFFRQGQSWAPGTRSARDGVESS